MDASKINLSSLKDKIAGKLSGKDTKSTKKNNKANKKKESHNKNAKPDSKEDEVLRQEALALGATEEDIELLKGIESADESELEFESEEKGDKLLSADLSKFMKGIGLEGHEVDVVSDNEVPELVEDEEGSEEGSEEESEVESELAESLKEESKEESESESEQEESDDSESEPESEEDEAEVVEKKIEKKVEKKQQKDSDKITDFSAVDSSKLAIPSRLDWYNTPLEPVDSPEKLDRFAIERLYERAQEVVEKDNQTYLKEFTSNNSQRKFLSQILSDGTLNDKISALTLLVQESPLHNLKAFDTLLGFCEKKSRTAALQAINAFKDLLVNGLLPDRRLLAFNKRPLRKDLSDTHLAVYFFEDHLKKSYFKLVQTLEHLSHDPISHVKMNVLGHIFDLITAKPEQEANLLRLGVNKLGDTDNKVSGKASYSILQLEQAHPAMKKIIVESVIDTIFKPGSEYNVQYYSILTLNQTILTRSEPELANDLVKTYFSLFRKVLIETDSFNVDKKEDKALGKVEHGRKNLRKNFKKGKKGGKSVKNTEKTESEVVEEKNTKLFSALLTGLNRAFPFSSLSDDVYEQHLDTLFKITHSSNFNTSVQALVLVHHIISKQKLNPDRFYRTLYESLLDPRLLNSSKQGIYLNLLFKALKEDTSEPNRVLAFVKRILQVCSHWLNIGTTAGMLYLLMELSKVYPEVGDLLVSEAERPDNQENGDEKEGAKPKSDEEYDSRKRDPKFANAYNSCIWEITQFANHYHPTVSVYAQSFLEGKEQPKPDLGLYSLSHFLDRFVYRNAKQKPVTKGSSIMQPLGGSHTGSLLVKATNVVSDEIPVNTENWLAKKSSDIKPDESFFHHYFSTKESKLRSKDKKKSKGEDEEELDDDEVWSALVKSRPEIEEESDGSIDFDEEDFSDMSDGEDQAEDSDNGDNEGIVEGSEIEDDFADFDGKLEIPTDDESDLNINFIEEDDEISSEEEPESKKRSREDDDDKKSDKKSKKKLKQLPVFASVDAYSQYLDSDDEDYS